MFFKRRTDKDVVLLYSIFVDQQLLLLMPLQWKVDSCSMWIKKSGGRMAFKLYYLKSPWSLWGWTAGEWRFVF